MKLPARGHAVVGPARVTWADVDAARDRDRDFRLGRSLIGAVVAELFPAAASSWSIGSAACPRCGKRHGAVEISGVPAVASVSYATGMVVAAVAPSGIARSIGVDVEPDSADATRTRDLEGLLGPSGQPVLRRWTRIEAVLKADGRGLLVDPASVRFDGDCAFLDGGPTRYQVADVPGPAGFVVSLAWCDAESSAASPVPATG